MPLPSTLRALADYDAPLLANTIGYIDPTPAEELYLGGTIQCQTPAMGPMVGVAVTMEMDSSSPGGAGEFDSFYEQLEQIQRVGAPVIWVVKVTGSRPDHECVLGDGTAKELFSAGCIGCVTDGGVRDVAGYASVPFHAFARHKVVHHTALRFGAINRPALIGGLTIRTGDILFGSAEGVIKIPPACLEVLPERAAKMRAFENEASGVFRQPDIAARSKGDRVYALLVEYGFAQPAK